MGMHPWMPSLPHKQSELRAAIRHAHTPADGCFLVLYIYTIYGNNEEWPDKVEKQHFAQGERGTRCAYFFVQLIKST